MHAKQLIEENNLKRNQLTEENEKYYEDMLIYIRTHLFISEQQTEELVMELLDHLIEAQEAGKSAQDVFGDDPKTYCDDMIKHLPKEKGKNAAVFIGYLNLQFLGFSALASGAVTIIASFFTQVNPSIAIGSSLLTFIIDIGVIFATIAFIFMWIRRSMFKRSNKIKAGIVIGSLSALTMAIFIFVPRLMPSFGYRIEIGGYEYLLAGLVILVISKIINRKFHITK
ncbi:hypothetical protein GCM10011391_05680 [Pullulanibacillus camelliae]|uniref:DUF1129 family protein n=1 Tax=Pullulanibacillus camelliae TaxID=1707096 RepID=A0A8J2VN17_9BACL|nr:DUF1129 family protein [Pullulanibacillus camelliae]GGE29998.1 hypothetical protein GCM10011391_05680 [Pullulanibacillus camelliae]